MLDESMFDNCKWCNGRGTEPDGYYPCPDCEGTGMKGGKYALAKLDELINKYFDEMEKQAKKQGGTPC